MNFKNRLDRLKEKLSTFPADALLIEQPVDLFYLTGLEMSCGQLLVTEEGSLLFADNRYFEVAQRLAPCPVELSDVKPFYNWISQHKPDAILSLAFDSQSCVYHRYEELQKLVPAKLVAVNNPVGTLRLIKDKDELDLLRSAAKLGSEGFDYVATLLKEGISEIEIATELEIFWKRKGSKSLAFDPIIAFGANASSPHYRAGETRLKPGMEVLVDIGVNLGHYHSDMTRVLFFKSVDPRIAAIYEIVAEAQQRALKLCKPGITIGELDRAARGYIEEKGYGENFRHGLGHGVGLEIHEAPTIRGSAPFAGVKLEKGMVITIEPGIYLPGVGGVRLEDTVAITDTGYENLTNRPIGVQVT